MSAPPVRYGDSSPPQPADELVYQELRRNGFSVLRDVLARPELEYCRRAIDDQALQQAATLDAAELESIGETDIVRAPLIDDDFFLTSVAMAPQVLAVARHVVGHYCLLHLQNAVINRPDRPHHQMAWHRDLPYLDRTSSSALAISALFCIDEFTSETGATWCLPGSHLVADPPSAEFLEMHGVPVEAAAGDVIMFDSMLVHRAGANRSANLRRAVNNVYSVGLIRQQIDLPRALVGRHASDPELAVFLGYESNAPVSAEDYRLRRLRRFVAP